MTKVQLHYDLVSPLTDALLTRISDAHSILGIFRIQPGDSGENLTVEYDSSRLTPKEVEAALRRAGVPAKPRR